MGIVFKALLWRGNAHIFQELHTPSACLPFIQPFMDRNGLLDLVPYCKYRIERGHWFLKHHGNVISSNLLHLLFTQIQEVLAVKQYLAPHDLTWGLGDDS
jgi:hypothetical protein